METCFKLKLTTEPCNRAALKLEKATKNDKARYSNTLENEIDANMAPKLVVQFMRAKAEQRTPLVEKKGKIPALRSYKEIVSRQVRLHT